jgi:hypothetical protein
MGTKATRKHETTKVGVLALSRLRAWCRVSNFVISFFRVAFVAISALKRISARPDGVDDGELWA